jgi:hypothetical protein
MIPLRPGGKGPDHTKKLQAELEDMEEKFLLRRKPSEKQMRAAQLLDKRGLSSLALVPRARTGMPKSGMKKTSRPWHEEMPDKVAEVLGYVDWIRRSLGLSDRFHKYLQEFIVYGNSRPELIDPCPLYMGTDSVTGEPKVLMRIYGDTTIEEVKAKWRILWQFQAKLPEAIGGERKAQDVEERAFGLAFNFKARKAAGKLEPGQTYATEVVKKLCDEFKRAISEPQARMMAKRYEEWWRRRNM